MSTPTFDFIIVGGGTSGSVLASRLSIALPTCTFLLIEAGPSSDPRIEPTSGYHQGLDPSLEWSHHSIPQKGLNGRIVPQPQGKIMGGSSAINAQGWTRGPSVDFNQWAAKVGDERWSWDGLLPYFKKSETFYPTPDQKTLDTSIAHGFDGPIKISHSTNSGMPRNYPLRDTIAGLYESIGVPKILDHNSGQTLGYSDVQTSIYGGKRYWSAGNYKPGSNVTTWTESIAEKLVFDGKVATAVQVWRNGPDQSSQNVTVEARKEILVASGVQGSAKLLLLSGIGPRHELEKHHIHQVTDLPVGENYSDHPVVQTYWKLKESGLSFGDGPIKSPECDWTAGPPLDYLAWHQHNEVINSVGAGVDDSSLIDWLLAEGKVHTESFAMYGHFDMAHAGIPHPGGSCIILASCLMTPTSRGTLTLQSADFKDAPILDPNTLGNDLDRELLVAVGRLTTSMMHGPVGQKIGAKEYGIDDAIQGDTSDEAMMARIFKTGRTCNHGSGTCAMGLVVDAECRVKGIEGLRVVDSSVLPFPLAAHLQAAVYAVAEQVAQMIIDEQKS